MGEPIVNAGKAVGQCCKRCLTALCLRIEFGAVLRGDRMLRLKGLVNAAGEPGPRAVHAVQHTLYPSARLPAWPSDDHTTRLVFIGRGLEEREVAGILH